MNFTRPSPFGRLLTIIKKSNIYLVVLTPLVISLLALALLLSIGNMIYQGEIPEVYFASSGVIFLLILSLSGIVQIIRQEGLGLFGQPVFGVWPIITGIIIIVICWVLTITLVFYIYRLITI